MIKFIYMRYRHDFNLSLHLSLNVETEIKFEIN